MSLIPWLGKSPGKGNGNLLHYSCLENSMDRGARRATVHGIEKSGAWLSDRSVHIGSERVDCAYWFWDVYFQALKINIWARNSRVLSTQSVVSKWLDFRVAQMVKYLPATQETWVWSLGQEDPLKKGMATYSSILAWRIHGQRSLTGYSPCPKELDMTEQLTFPLSGMSSGTPHPLKRSLPGRSPEPCLLKCHFCCLCLRAVLLTLFTRLLGTNYI